MILTVVLATLKHLISVPTIVFNSTIKSLTCSPPGKFRRLGTNMHLADRAHMAKQLCTAAIVGLTLASAHDRAEVDRDLDVLELWSGVGSIVRAGSTWSYNARGFDIKGFRI